jgi:hypothetical protein
MLLAQSVWYVSAVFNSVAGLLLLLVDFFIKYCDLIVQIFVYVNPSDRYYATASVGTTAEVLYTHYCFAS